MKFSLVSPQRVGILHFFGLKTGIDRSHFVLESGITFKEIRECMNMFLISIPNEKERKKKMRIRNDFQEIFFVAVLI